MRITLNPGPPPTLTSRAIDSGPIGSSASVTVTYGDTEITFADEDMLRALVRAAQEHFGEGASSVRANLDDAERRVKGFSNEFHAQKLETDRLRGIVASLTEVLHEQQERIASLRARARRDMLERT